MKKLLAIVLVMAMLCSLTACGEFVLFRETKPLQVKRVFPRGTIEGRNYENQLIGIGFKRRDDWTYFSDERIKELDEATLQVIDAEERAELKKADMVYDMVVADKKRLSSINVIAYDSLKAAALKINTDYESQIPGLEKTLRDMGYGSIKCEVTTVVLGGKEVSCLKITAGIAGKRMEQVCICLRCKGYWATITIATFDEDNLQDLLDAFYWLE